MAPVLNSLYGPVYWAPVKEGAMQTLRLAMECYVFLQINL